MQSTFLAFSLWKFISAWETLSNIQTDLELAFMFLEKNADEHKTYLDSVMALWTQFGNVFYFTALSCKKGGIVCSGQVAWKYQYDEYLSHASSACPSSCTTAPSSDNTI